MRRTAKKRGTPKALLLSIRDYVRLAAPEPEVLKLIGEDSRRKGTSALSSRQIDQVMKATRAKIGASMIALRLVIDTKHPRVGGSKAGRTPAHCTVDCVGQTGEAVCLVTAALAQAMLAKSRIALGMDRNNASFLPIKGPRQPGW